MTQGQGLGEVNKSPYGNVNVNAGNGPASKWAWDSGYSTPAGETEAGKRKREGDTQTPGSQVLAGTPVSGVGAGAGHAGQPAGRDFDYSSDEMDDDMEDDEEDEDIEREPLPGENIFSRIRRDGSDVGNEDDVEEDGTAIIHVRRAAAAEEVDELESVNGGEQEHKVGQVKKIKLVLNNNGGKGKAGKMIIGPDGKPRKRSVWFVSSGRVGCGQWPGERRSKIRGKGLLRARGRFKGDARGWSGAWHGMYQRLDRVRLHIVNPVQEGFSAEGCRRYVHFFLHELMPIRFTPFQQILSGPSTTYARYTDSTMLATRNPLDVFFANYSDVTTATNTGTRMTVHASSFGTPLHRPRPRRHRDLPALRTSKLIERVKRGSGKRRARSNVNPGMDDLWGLDTSDAMIRNRRGRSWPLVGRTPSPLSRTVDQHDDGMPVDDDPETLALDHSDENRAVKRRKVVGDGASEGSVPPKDKGKAGLIDGELKVPGPRRSGGSRRADRPRRPPPLEMSSGNRELPPPSAGMMSSMRNTGMVSPVVSGFPLHQADKVTREAVSSGSRLVGAQALSLTDVLRTQFRNSMAIKDAQRNLIQQRKDGAQPPPSDLPGGGPPPSAGPLPTLLTYIPTPSSGEGSGSFSDRRGDGVKHKVKSMKLNTGDMSSVRDGLRVSLCDLDITQ